MSEREMEGCEKLECCGCVDCALTAWPRRHREIIEVCFQPPTV